MILAGLWFSNEKPSMQMFLHPFINALRRMETEGVLAIVL